MEYVAIGKVVDTFGVKGELKVRAYAPDEVFEKLKKVFFKRVEGSYVPFKVDRVRAHGGFFILKLGGYDTLDKVEQFRGATLFLPDRELPEIGTDEFYAYELTGMEVITDEGKRIGKVERVEDFGAYDVLMLEGGKIIPFVKDIVLVVDKENRKIEVRGIMLPY